MMEGLMRGQMLWASVPQVWSAHTSENSPRDKSQAAEWLWNLIVIASKSSSCSCAKIHHQHNVAATGWRGTCNFHHFWQMAKMLTEGKDFKALINLLMFEPSSLMGVHRFWSRLQEHREEQLFCQNWPAGQLWTPPFLEWKISWRAVFNRSQLLLVPRTP